VTSGFSLLSWAANFSGLVMDKGTDPKDPRVQVLVKRWNELILEFIGGDPGITQSLKNVYRGEPEFAAQQSLDGGIFDYVRKASNA
jgi:hypothetical protein